MNWEKFNSSKREYPEKIIESAIEGFSKATDHLVEMKISPVTGMSKTLSRLRKDFIFKVDLISPYLESYIFNVFSFGYNVELTPIVLNIDDSIYEEIFKRSKNFSEELVTANNEDELRTLIKSIFSCYRFEEIVQGIMKIAERTKMDLN